MKVRLRFQVKDGDGAPEFHFIEAEDEDGISVKLGEWVDEIDDETGDGYRFLEFDVFDDQVQRPSRRAKTSEGPREPWVQELGGECKDGRNIVIDNGFGNGLTVDLEGARKISNALDRLLREKGVRECTPEKAVIESEKIAIRKDSLRHAELLAATLLSGLVAGRQISMDTPKGFVMQWKAYVELLMKSDRESMPFPT